MKRQIKWLLPILLVTAICGLVLFAYAMNESVTNLKFNHKYHTDEVGATCIQCHGSAREVKPGIRAVPSHEQCKECHEDDLKNACTKCHVGKEGGGFGKPVSHLSPDWQKIHGMEAAGKTTECNVCHQQSSCDQCHNGNNVVSGSPHPAGWRFNHATEAAFGGRCYTCHESSEKCVACHRASIPIPHALGSVWANPTTGGEHKDEAEKYMVTCLACHDMGKAEPTCARCHNK